jgi:hypothetical protein
MASLNDTVGSKAHLKRAVERLATSDMPTWLEAKAGEARAKLYDVNGSRSWRMAKDPGPEKVHLKGLDPSDRLAVEMWLSEEDEARALAGELALLERQWQEAEQLAKIADSLVTEAHAE